MIFVIMLIDYDDFLGHHIKIAYEYFLILLMLQKISVIILIKKIFFVLSTLVTTN